MYHEYLLSVTCAAVLSSIISGFFDKKGSISALIKILCGVFVTLAVIRPVIQLDLSGIDAYVSNFTLNTSSAADQGFSDATQAQCAVIQQKAEAYVYDKAAQLNCDIGISIRVNPEVPYQPVSAQISGAVSPYAKNILTDIMTRDLGIPEEEQRWIS